MSTPWNSEHPASPFATEAQVWSPADGVGISEMPYETSVFQAFEDDLEAATPPVVQEIAELRRAHEALEWGAVRRAITAGNRDPGRLTNLVFLARHPERGVRALSPSEPGYAALAAEREAIRDTIVRPLLAASPAPSSSTETWLAEAERMTNGHDPAGSAWLETSTTGAEEVAGQHEAPSDQEHWAIAPTVGPQDGARGPATSVAAWAALARALLNTAHEAGPSLGGAASGIGDATAAELPYLSEAPAAPSYIENALIKAEIGKGVRNENVLADLVFYRRYPARNRRPLVPTEPNFSTLSQEWLRIRDTQVRPLLATPPPSVGRPYIPAPPAGSPGPSRGGAALPLPRAAIGELKELQDPHHSGRPGIDLQASNGTPIYAVVGGTVERAGEASGFGSHAVYIRDAAGFLWMYGHGSAHHVAEGQRVAAGHHIADVGSEGQSTGPHLHLEVRDTNDVRRCPQPLLTAVWNGQTPPPVGSLPTSGCTYSSSP